MGGQAADGSGGRTTGGSGSVMGGNGGNGASATGGTSVGGAGGAPGGEAGMSGTGAAGQGGFSGASDGGAGGEGGVDEETARCERICSRVDYLMCESWSACVVFYCEVAANTYPYCKPYADAYRKCVDEEVTPDGFVCWAGHATALYVPGKSPCYAEVVAADDANCL
jgi:hypothetical protein